MDFKGKGRATAAAGEIRLKPPQIYTRSANEAVDGAGGAHYAIPRVAAAMADLGELNPSIGSERTDAMVLEIARRVNLTSDPGHEPE